MVPKKISGIILCAFIAFVATFLSEVDIGKVSKFFIAMKGLLVLIQT